MFRVTSGLAMAVVMLCAEQARTEVIDLFNGQDLSGFTVHGAAEWAVEGGVLFNVQTAADDSNYLAYDDPLRGSNFILSTRVRTTEGMRFRLLLDSGDLYIGNEGYIRQLEVYGNKLSDVVQVADDSYELNEWCDLKLKVDEFGSVELFKNDVLTHTGTVEPLGDLAIRIHPGDSWSPGKIEMTSLQYEPIPEPSTIVLLLTGALGFLGFAWRRRRAGQ